MTAIGDESFRAVEHPSALRLGSRHASAARIRPRRRLRQPPGTDVLTRRQLRDVFLFLRFIARDENVIRAKRSMRRYDDADRPIDPRQLFNRRDVLHVPHPRAAIFRRKDDPQQIQPSQLLDDRHRKLAGFVPRHHVRSNLALGELPHAFLQLQLLVIQLEVQNVPPKSSPSPLKDLPSQADRGICLRSAVHSELFAGGRARGQRRGWHPTTYLTMECSDERNTRTDRLVTKACSAGVLAGCREGVSPSHLTWKQLSLYLFSVPKIFRASQTGATNTCAGLVRNAGLFPSIKCPSHASANAVGISSSAITQCHQTTMREENPTGIAIMCKARLTG